MEQFYQSFEESINHYQQQMGLAKIEILLAECALDWESKSLHHLEEYYRVCMDAVNFAELNGDDTTLFFLLNKLHGRLVNEASSFRRQLNFRKRCYLLAQNSLFDLRFHYLRYDEHEKISQAENQLAELDKYHLS